MAELKIIGVRRVEALLNVLNTKEKEAIASLVIPSYSDINATVDAEFGISDKQARVDELLTEANELLAEINTVTGDGLEVKKSSNYRRQRETDGDAYRKRVKELEEQLRNKPIADVKAAFEAKRTQLWMCETLEDAKAIVGVA